MSTAFVLLLLLVASGGAEDDVEVKGELETIIVHNGRVYAELGYIAEQSAAEGHESWRKPKFCDLHIVEEEYKQGVLTQLSKRYPIKQVDFDTMLFIVNACEDLQPFPDSGSKVGFSAKNKTTTTEQGNQQLSLFALLKGIVPGTKWCGVNDIANDYRDLGKDFRLDKCCRAHDHCPCKIKAFSENYGVRNYHPYTKSHCSCDDRFYECLKEAGDEKSAAVGNFFFNVLSLQCAADVKQRYCIKYANSAGAPDDHQQQETLVPEKRFSWGRIGQALGLASNSFGQGGQDSNEKCLEWVEDTDAPPKYAFRMPRRKF